MTSCFFVSDLHGRIERYNKLFSVIEREHPDFLFLGGDLTPSGLFSLTKRGVKHDDFIKDFLIPGFSKLRKKLEQNYPRIFLILGNDDSKLDEKVILDAAQYGIWDYLHNRKVTSNGFNFYGYSFVPPTPFRLKDWEKYDVSRYVDPGCVSPEEGAHSVPVAENELKYSTIQKDLEQLTGNDDLSKAVFLFHTPPYKTKLDRAALDNKMVDYVPLDVHVGSIAVKRFIEDRKPFITLHGHVHESARLTGSWNDKIGITNCFSAAHDGPELALVRFNLEAPSTATRELI